MDTGGAAFPDPTGSIGYSGMTYLDFMAGLAMAGLSANSSMFDATVEETVQIAFGQADAMLVEKRRREEKETHDV